MSFDTRLNSIPRGTDATIYATLKINSIAQDITGDTVTIRFKFDPKAADPGDLEVVGDVAAQGADGIVRFDLTGGEGNDTDIAPKQYNWGIEWITAAGKQFVPLSGVVKITERVSDVST